MAINLEVYPNPDPTTFSVSSTYYSVSVMNDASAYQNSHVYSGTRMAWVLSYAVNRNLWPVSSSPVISYTTFEIDGSTTARVSKIGGSISSIDIGPYSKNKNSVTTLSGGVAYIPVNKYDKLWVTIDNNVSSPLFIFADPPTPAFSAVSADYPTGSGWTHIRFTSGVHFMSALGGTLDTAEGYPNRRKLTSKTLVYSDPGAYVKGHFNISGCNDIKLMGKGVYSLEFYDWWGSYLGQSDSVKSHGMFLYSTNASTPSAYLDWRLSGNGISGVTVVGTPFYFNGEGSLQQVDNVKYISPWNYNTDGFRIFNYYNRTTGAFVKNSFIFIADDVSFPGVGQSQSNCLVSGNYLSTHHGSLFVNYFTVYNNGLDTGSSFGFSAIDIDSRVFIPDRIGINAVFRLLSDSAVTSLPANYAGILNCTFSGIRVENDIATPAFLIGNIDYPFAAYGNKLGMLSGLDFKNISFSSTYTGSGSLSANIISGLNSTNEVKNTLFENVTFNGVKLTEANKNTYFSFSGSTDPTADNIRFNSDFPTNMKVTPIKLLN